MATTWALTGTKSAKATCTTGSESAPANPVKASVTVAFSSAAAGNTVTIRGKTFTAIANGGTASAYQFAVGAGGSANTDTGAAFAAAVNARSDELGYTASNASGTVTLTATCYGTHANTWPITRVGAPITLGASTFANGVSAVGVDLSDVASIAIKVEAVTAGQTVAGGSLLAYLLNVRSYRYLRAPELDKGIGTALQGYAFGADDVRGKEGWLVYVPSGATISSGNAVVYVDAYDKNGRFC